MIYAIVFYTATTDVKQPRFHGYSSDRDSAMSVAKRLAKLASIKKTQVIPLKEILAEFNGSK